MTYAAGSLLSYGDQQASVNAAMDHIEILDESA